MAKSAASEEVISMQNSPEEENASLSGFLWEIERLQQITEQWSEEQKNTVKSLQYSQDALCAEAFRRILKGLIEVPGAAEKLRELAGDEVVYTVLRHHELIKPSLDERIEKALESVRPFLNGHGGDVEIVAITSPNRVQVRLTGSCDGCPASAVTLTSRVKQAIQIACPEIIRIEAWSEHENSIMPETIVSPFEGDSNAG